MRNKPTGFTEHDFIAPGLVAKTLNVFEVTLQVSSEKLPQTVNAFVNHYEVDEGVGQNLFG